MNHINLNLNVSTRDKVDTSVSPILKQVKNPDGSVSIIETDKFENPYEGLNADSFSIQSQVDAGVRLQPSPKSKDISIGRVDKVTSDVQTVINANQQGIKLNSKIKK